MAFAFRFFVRGAFYLQVEIKGISHNGEGIARIAGKVTFIPYAIPGETVEIALTAEKKNYNRGQLIDILKPSKHRTVPLCPHYYGCGGCSYQHVDYTYQLELKRQVVQNNISKIAKLDIDVGPVISSDKIYGYRNKVAWHIDKNKRLGYYQRGTNDLVEIKTCKLISAQMKKATNWFRENINEFPLTGKSKIIIRESSVSGESTVIITNLNTELNDGVISRCRQEITALFVSHIGKPGYKKVFGPDKLEEKAGGVDILLSSGTFFQVNHRQMEIIIDLVGEYLDLNKNDILLDAYCGSGGLSLPFAQNVKEVIGIESFAPAIDDAKENARLNHLDNCEFLVGYAEKVLPKLDQPFNKVIVDPPRSGLKGEAIKAITTAKPGKIAYVSCNPATLSRDLAIFAQEGYKPKIIQPLDMFPQTGHVECVALMSRIEN